MKIPEDFPSFSKMNVPEHAISPEVIQIRKLLNESDQIANSHKRDKNGNLPDGITKRLEELHKEIQQLGIPKKPAE